MKKTTLLIAAAVCLIGLSASAQYSGQPYPSNPQTYAPPQQGYAQPPYGQQPAYAPPPPAPYCQPYSDKFSIGGEVRITRGLACLHPDGSWELRPDSAGMRYVTRGGSLFLVPSTPFAVVVVGDHHHHHYPY